MSKLNDNLYVNFESLKENKDWQKIYNGYKNNLDTLKYLIENISKKYNTSMEESRDIVLYELMCCHYNRNHRKHMQDMNRFKWSLIYVFTLIFIFFSGIISIFLPNKKYEKDVLFEEMFANKGWSLRFYRYIYKILKKNKNLDCSVLYTHPGITKDFSTKEVEGWNGEVINKRYLSIVFDLKTSLIVIFKSIFYLVKLFILSKNINIIYLYLRIIRKYLVYNSQVKNIKANVIVAAGDYYWNPIKYIAYKKRIKNIVLLQHNFKNEYLFNRLFQYCDYYYAHSEQAVEKIEGMDIAKKHSIGSFQLIPYLEDIPLKYDVLFINQTVNDDLKNAWPDLDQDKLVEKYYLLIDNLKQYLIDNPNINMVYVAKGETIESEPSLSVKERLKGLENIEFIGSYGPQTFELIKQSKVIINMYSSLGFESYGFDKRVLWVNYDRCCDYFKYDVEKEDLHVLIDDTSYDTFCDRLNRLLVDDDEEVQSHYQSLKRKYMNIQENPAKIVAQKVEELIG